MRLIDWQQPEAYQPLERGAAFPQTYENGDKFRWWNPMDFNNRYWINFIQWSDLVLSRSVPYDERAECLMMGGEL